MSNARILTEFPKEAIAMIPEGFSSQEWLGLLSPELSCPIKRCYIRLRFLRSKFSPWMTLAIVPLKILTTSGISRTHEKNRYMSAVSKINFAEVYVLLNELLW